MHSFTETEEKDYFKFNKSVAPVQLGIFPLVNKEGPREIAQELTENLRMAGFTVEYDATGTIGKDMLELMKLVFLLQLQLISIH